MLGHDGKGHPDYLEQDAASSGSIEDIRNILDLAKAPPMFGKFRVIALDEVHTISGKAFDAILKLLEEPPPYLVFIFLTTDLSRVQKTIQSRCARLEVSTLPDDIAKEHLIWVCNQEGIKYEDEALDIIVHIALGHPRDLLQRLEELTHYGDEITLELTKRVFSLDSVDYISRYVKALLEGDFLKQLEAIREWGSPPNIQFRMLTEFFLFYFQTYHLRVQYFITNPFLLLFQKSTLTEIHNEFLKKAKGAGITLEEVCVPITDFWTARSESEPQSSVAMHYILLALHNLVNVNNFRSEKSKSVTKNPIKASAIGVLLPRASRIMTVVAPVEIAPDVTPPILVKEDIILEKEILYAHNLKEHGFGAPLPIGMTEMGM
jgi:DNA polymerase III subunit gamma/tau